MIQYSTLEKTIIRRVGSWWDSVKKKPRVVFNCRSPQARIIHVKLEWWVQAIFWKKPEERGECTLAEPLKYHVAKNGGAIVKLFLCLLWMESRTYWCTLGKLWVLVWRRMPWIKQDGELELERLLLEWDKSSPPPFTGINPDQNWIDWLIDF